MTGVGCLSLNCYVFSTIQFFPSVQTVNVLPHSTVEDLVTQIKGHENNKLEAYFCGDVIPPGKPINDMGITGNDFICVYSSPIYQETPPPFNVDQAATFFQIQFSPPSTINFSVFIKKCRKKQSFYDSLYKFSPALVNNSIIADMITDTYYLANLATFDFLCEELERMPQLAHGLAFLLDYSSQNGFDLPPSSVSPADFMDMLNRSMNAERRMIEELMATTNATHNQVINALRDSNWDPDLALERLLESNNI